MNSDADASVVKEPEFPGFHPGRLAFQRLLLGLILLLFLVRNLPWHLEDYDQAKQAYAAFEIAQGGSWWRQHTPYGDCATKPPLLAWLSVAARAVTGSWDWAWRLPSLLAALLLLRLLYLEGERLLPGTGGILAAAAFGLNQMAPRLATLVRTDMTLTLLVTAVGGMMLAGIARPESWSNRRRWAAAGLLTAALLVKGPIAYVFLLPGAAGYALYCRRRGVPNHAWCGWWPWLAPLAVFLAWVAGGVLTEPAFREQVVVREFLMRFRSGQGAVHASKPVFYYLTHLIHKFSPWSIALLAVAFNGALRRAAMRRPAVVWLCLWALGGLLAMSLVPSKRADRIFPVVPPLCLLLPAFLASVTTDPAAGQQRLRWLAALIAAAVIMAGGHTAWKLATNATDDQGALADFGRRAREAARRGGLRMAVCVDLQETNDVGENEAMLLYCRQARLLNPAQALDAWRAQRVNTLVVDSGALDEIGPGLAPCELLASSRAAPSKTRRYCLVRRAAGKEPPREE